MVAWQGLTGLPPGELPRDPSTGELDYRPWLTPQNQHLLSILAGMTRCYPQDRYPSAAAVLKELQKPEPILLNLLGEDAPPAELSP